MVLTTGTTLGRVGSWQPAGQPKFPFVLGTDGAGMVDALQAPFQKINLQSLLADLPLQLCDASFGPAVLSLARRYVARPLANLTPPAVQHVRVHFKRPRHLPD